MDYRSGGYVRLYRRLLQNPIWTQLSPAVFKVMMGFLIKANWEPKSWYDGQDLIEIPRGSFVTSYGKMAGFCHLSVKQTRAAFKHLEGTRFAAYTRASRWTMVTVLNYDCYQASVNDEGTDEGMQADIPRAGRRATTKDFKKKELTICAFPDEPLPGFPSVDDPPFGNLDGEDLQDGIDTDHQGQVRQKGLGYLQVQQETWFAEWWSQYWLRKAKKPAREAFQKRVKTEARFRQVMAATRAQAPEMLQRQSAHRPHGASWLNQERWEDEPESVKEVAGANDDYPELTA